MLQTDSDQLDDALGQVDSNGGIDGIEPLINRRKTLLRSKKPSPSLEKRILGFNLESTTSNFDINEKPEYLSSVAEQSSATRNRIKESKSISSSIRRQERIRDRVDVSSPTEEYLSGLNKSFYQPQTSSSNNFQVKQLYLQAKHADQRGDIKGAKHFLNQLLQETPNDSRVLRRLSRLHIEEGNHNDARRILLSGLKSNPKDGHLLHGLARLELSSGNLDGARRDFKASIRATPEFPNPYHALGTLEHSLGKIRVATTVLRMGLKQCPTNHRLHHALGDLYRDAKMFDLAEKCYRTGLDCLDAESKYKGKNMLWSKSFLYTAMSYVSYEKNEKMECRTWLRKSIEQTGNRMHSQGW
jgi:Flp pilus assembly protein TadD